VGLLSRFSKASSGAADPLADPAQRKRVVYAYHEQTKHHPYRFAAGPYELDWASQPDPFRRWIGADLVRLDRAPPGSEPLASRPLDSDPLYPPALAEGGVPPAALEPRAISQLLFDSLALSAWKQAGASKWALRVNPSSGNLHPTEGYLLLPAIAGISAGPAVFHYAPAEHGLELRAEIPAPTWRELTAGLPPGSLLAGLTSIHWREAWKYGERAFRYCQHDAGHAVAALSIAAAALGWKVELLDGAGTLELGALLGVFAEAGPEAESPECLLLVRPCAPVEPAAARPIVTGLASRVAALAPAFRALDWRGRANDLSPEHVEWEAIELAARACVEPPSEEPYAVWPRPPRATAPEPATTSLRRIVRQRRSCLALDGKTAMSASAFFRVLESTLPRAGRFPFNALPWSPRLHLAVFAHRIDGLQPGLYWLQRDPDRLAAVRAACRAEFLWERAAGAPEDLPLRLLLPLDLRRVAAQVSCNQDIAGDGAFSLGMIADFERSIEEHGAWFYPRLFWEAGTIGQVLYLEAEALGLRATGIGCFFDDPVHSILGLSGRAFQSLYHFTMGGAVEDPRLSTLPAYPEREGAG